MWVGVEADLAVLRDRDDSSRFANASQGKNTVGHPKRWEPLDLCYLTLGHYMW